MLLKVWCLTCKHQQYLGLLGMQILKLYPNLLSQKL